MRIGIALLWVFAEGHKWPRSYWDIFQLISCTVPILRGKFITEWEGNACVCGRVDVQTYKIGIVYSSCLSSDYATLVWHGCSHHAPLYQSKWEPSRAGTFNRQRSLTWLVYHILAGLMVRLKVKSVYLKSEITLAVSKKFVTLHDYSPPLHHFTSAFYF